MSSLRISRNCSTRCSGSELTAAVTASRAASRSARALTCDPVDKGGGGRETGPDPVVTRLAQHDAGDRRPPAADRANRPEREGAAGRLGRAGLDAHEPEAPEQCIGVEHGARNGQRRAVGGDDAGEHGQPHGPVDDAQLVGRCRDGRVVVAAGVGVSRVCHPERAGGFVHPRDEPLLRAGVPAGQDCRDIVRRRQQERLERLPLGQLLAGGNGHDRLLLSAAPLGVRDDVLGERDRRAVLAGAQRMVTEDDIGRHHLGHAGNRSRVLIRPGQDRRPPDPNCRLAVFRPHCDGQSSAGARAAGWPGNRRGRRQGPVAEAAGNRCDSDGEHGGDAPPADPDPSGGRLRCVAVGHPSSLGCSALPARIRISICRRYAAPLPSGHACFAR